MPAPTLDLAVAADLIERADAIVEGALAELLERGGVDENDALAYDVAHAASALATARSVLAYATKGDTESNLVAAFLALALSDLAGRVLGRESLWRVTPEWFSPFSSFVADYRDTSFLATLAESPDHAPAPRRGLRNGRGPLP